MYSKKDDKSIYFLYIYASIQIKIQLFFLADSLILLSNEVS